MRDFTELHISPGGAHWFYHPDGTRTGPFYPDAHQPKGAAVIHTDGKPTIANAPARHEDPLENLTRDELLRGYRAMAEKYAEQVAVNRALQARLDIIVALEEGTL